MQARTLLLYDPVNNITTNDDMPLHVQNANPESGFRWIHNTDQDLQVTWQGHFENRQVICITILNCCVALNSLFKGIVLVYRQIYTPNRQTRTTT